MPSPIGPPLRFGISYRRFGGPPWWNIWRGAEGTKGRGWCTSLWFDLIHDSQCKVARTLTLSFLHKRSPFDSNWVFTPVSVTLNAHGCNGGTRNFQTVFLAVFGPAHFLLVKHDPLAGEVQWALKEEAFALGGIAIIVVRACNAGARGLGDGGSIQQAPWGSRGEVCDSHLTPHNKNMMMKMGSSVLQAEANWRIQNHCNWHL